MKDLYFIGSAVHDSYLYRISTIVDPDEISLKRRKLEEGIAQNVKELPAKYFTQKEDQIYCTAPIRDCVINEKNGSLIVASGKNNLGFLTTFYVFLYFH